MTKERFMELARRHEVSVYRAESLWKNRPPDIEEVGDRVVEELLELAKDPMMNLLSRAIEKFAESLLAHEKARMN